MTTVQGDCVLLMCLCSVEVRDSVSSSPVPNPPGTGPVSLLLFTYVPSPVSSSLPMISPIRSGESQGFQPWSSMIIPGFSCAHTFSFSWLSDPNLTLNMSNLEFYTTKISFLHDLIPVNQSQLGTLASSQFFSFLRT